MIKVFNGVEIFMRDFLIIRKCIQSIVIVKSCLLGLLSVLKTGDEKCNITKQFKCSLVHPLHQKNMIVSENW